MHGTYEDIIKRIDEPPKWYDENGTPRYDAPRPDLAPNIYASQVIFMLIKCQNCEKEFVVEMSYERNYPERELASFTERLENIPKNYVIFPIHYGDPPRHGCIGDTMNSIPLKILELWEEKKGVWKKNEKWSGVDITDFCPHFVCVQSAKL